MDENATHALMMAFGLFVLIIALSISVYMFTQVTYIAERLIYFSDSTNYYDSIKYDKSSDTSEIDITERYVNTDTIIPTLYRYYKENFCVKIYDATNGSQPKLIQIFDRNLENNVNIAVSDSKATLNNSDVTTDKSIITNYAYKSIFNKNDSPLYMFGAPWTGSTENLKNRIDYYINGTAGYIDGVYVDYTDNIFAKAIMSINPDVKFKEKFVSYSYSGDITFTEDGDELVNVDAKDKLVIIYTILGTLN